MGVPLVIIHLNGIVPYKPSIYRGTSMTMETPIFQREAIALQVPKTNSESVFGGGDL